MTTNLPGDAQQDPTVASPDTAGRDLRDQTSPLPQGFGAERERPVIVTPQRPTGPHVPAIMLGLVCVVVAGLALGQELGAFTVDWGNVGPLGIVAAGAVLVAFGLVGVLGPRRSTGEQNQQG
ncbi:hypothetical protein [Nostocoides sp. HKS02]|uniref:hypothetical protein n=1 Tax=Nostocoides sp. HKS02 TaxID=1813880 RepID=UPI0012B4CBE2|nr:hypothetical protein [Tetrasphaera sp. HKS02]QGN59263.1 hypothetical protein GKE56_16740 [Tetrasphaera sp. HKS02]